MRHCTRPRRLAPVLVAAALALPLGGCDPDLSGCWYMAWVLPSADIGLTLQWTLTPAGADYDVAGDWVYDSAAGPRSIGHSTGIALRSGDRVTISQQLTDCDGAPDGTIQFEGQWLPIRWVWTPYGVFPEGPFLEGTITIQTAGETNVVPGVRAGVSSDCDGFCDL